MPDVASKVERIEVFSCWMGFASPPSVAEKLILTCRENGFRREWLPDGEVDDVPPDRIAGVLAALALPPVPELDPSLLGFPEEAVRSHFSSMWTDDSPSFIAKILFGSGRVVSVQSQAQHAFMLPLIVFDSDEERGYATYDPRLSRAVATLMPDGFLGRGRLAEGGGMLASDLERIAEGEAMAEASSDASGGEPQLGEEPDAGTAAVSDEEFDAIVGMLFGDETPEEREEAERTGRISDRLLKYVSADDVRDLLARGADPNIADAAGQTALMRAAGPPLNREKFRLLVEAGAQVDARCNDGSTGLHIAAGGWMADAVDEWLRAGADVNARTSEGSTPLMLGVPSSAVVKRLVAAGADPNAVDHDGHTALVYAIIWQARNDPGEILDSIRALIAAGTDLNLRDGKGMTALGHARRGLSRVLVEQEAFYAFLPDIPKKARSLPDHRDKEYRLAEEIIALVTEAGGRD